MAEVESDELVLLNLPLVGHLVREVSQRVPVSVDRDDLRSAGMLALVAASKSYQAARGVPFSAYATTRIRGALVDELRSLDWASRSVRRRGREIEQTRQRLATALGEFPDDTLVAKELGMTLAEVRRADADADRAHVLSLHATDNDGAELVASRWPVPEDVVERTEKLAYVTAAVQELPERLRFVVEGYFLREQPMAELAAVLGVTESRISQLRAEAMVLMRAALESAYAAAQHAEGQVAGGVAARRRQSYVDAVAVRFAASARARTTSSASA
ncbi:sigma-70 family RNA polymerase sigma factor [Nocardioides sp. MAH-18]|uniref:Sigma-70 family RNA polymerase sigma factor n=1 Tax=Nocardioides agri TaxID=2682843 RepID=A0A6L6XSP4_9ACTN|nr:sigma-70 family RNA polymerase sigma factor [Nocardioides sp. CGMCC 1.13656]MVQ50230.1 sigma-70 family RNA polymerase sigma factor [Nocardioides sp. MAH-18]